MPYTFNGCGTTYYGNRDPGPDGSYITTLWVTLVYFPLVPLRSYRVLPVGPGSNYFVHSSQSYQTMRVPLCWRQVRNVYLCVSPILLLVFYFSWPDIQDWWKETTSKAGTAQIALAPEPPQAHPASLPLDSKAAAAACGNVLKLDKAAFIELDLHKRLTEIVNSSGFTDAELKNGLSPKELSQRAFEAYSFAYLTWEEAAETSRAEFDQMVINAAHQVDISSLSGNERASLEAYVGKLKRMMMRAFDLGRLDANRSPCP